MRRIRYVYSYIIMKGFRLWFVSACKITELTWEKSMLLFSCVWEPMDCSTPGFLVLHHLPKLAQSHVSWVSDASKHFVLCHPLLLLPLIFPSIRVFSNELALLEKPAWLNGPLLAKKCLLFNMLSKLVIAFLPRSKCLLILWLKSHHMQWFWSPRSEICHCLYCFPVYLAWSDGIRYYDLRYLNAEF